VRGLGTGAPPVRLRRPRPAVQHRPLLYAVLPHSSLPKAPLLYRPPRRTPLLLLPVPHHGDRAHLSPRGRM